ncbi:hypothetical protein [Endothiovibrio diazotrophicus]
MDEILTQYRREREVILEVLAAQDGGSADRKALWFGLSTLGLPMDQKTFLDHVQYLADKKYLTVTGKKAMRVTVFVVKITPAGRDVLHGAICDPGVGQGCPAIPAACHHGG